jgi:uncharacterized membrane protein YccC
MSPQLAALVPDLKRGVRAAIVTVIPFFLARRFERPELVWVALGGWFASLADPGGSVRARADAMAVFLVAGGVAITVGSYLAGSLLASTLWIGGVAWLASAARAFGGVATNVGTVIAIVATIATASSLGSLITAICFALGVVWAAAMSSLVWPATPHLPLRHAVARAYGALADYVEAILVELAAKDRRHESWAAMTRVRQRSVRSTLEAARAVMVELRARHTGETPVGANTQTLLGEAELQFFWLVAYSDVIEHETRGRASGEELATLLELARAYRVVRDQLLTRRPRAWVPREVRAEDPLATQLLEASRTAIAVSRDLDATPASSTVELSPATARTAALAASTAWTWRSLAGRHALRVAAAAMVAMIVGQLVSPEHSQWVSVTTIAVLQPYLGPTFVRVAERVVGTILGCAIGFAMIVLLASPLAIAAAMFPLVVLSVVTRPRSYRLFVLFLTPVFVLVADHWHPDLGTALDRILDVALGGVIAIVAAISVPSWERARLPDAIVEALDALAAYVRVAFDALEHGGDRDRVRAARRDVGIALESAEASLERMLAEPRRFRRGVAEAVFVLTYARRITSALTAFDEARVARTAPPALPPTEAVRAYLLEAVAAAQRFILTGTPTELHEPTGVDPSLTRFVHQADLLAAGRPRQSIPSKLAATAQHPT